MLSSTSWRRGTARWNAFRRPTAAQSEKSDVTILAPGAQARKPSTAAGKASFDERGKRAVGGGAVGGVVGGISAIDQSEDWELTYDEVHAGRILVAAHTDDPDQADRLDEILQKESPLKVERFDADGRRLATG